MILFLDDASPLLHQEESCGGTEPTHRRSGHVEAYVHTAHRLQATFHWLTTPCLKLVLKPWAHLRRRHGGSGAQRPVRETGDIVSSVQRTPGKVVPPVAHGPLSPPLGHHPACCPALMTYGCVLVLLLDREALLQCGSSAIRIPGSDCGANTESHCDIGHVT